jgi:hypothetical protein
MITNKEINNNPQRYSFDGGSWKVSSVADSPNSNSGGEIVPMEFPIGRFATTDTLKPLLVTDGVIVVLSSGEYLCSPSTLDTISEFQNPHWSILPNGEITIKDKRITLGKTVPLIPLNISNLQKQAQNMKVSNAIAGVESVEWIYEGRKIEGISVNLINQIDWTLTDGVDKLGDTFKVWDWELAPPSVYSIDALNISTTQEDGKFDKGKLETFIKEINIRLNQLNSDFSSIKRTFFNGETPPNSGTKEFSKIVAETIDNTPTTERFIEDLPTIIKGIEDTPKDKAVDSQKRATEDLAKKSAEALKVESDSLRTTQKTLSEKIAEAGGVTDYVRQKGGWDNFVKEIRNQNNNGTNN